MKNESLLAAFELRVCKIIDNTRNMDWGFHEDLIFIYFDFHNEFPKGVKSAGE